MFSTRPILPKDNEGIARVIREVSKEFGLSAESGYGVSDPTLDNLFNVYNIENAQYWVVVDGNDQIYGGGGLSPLKGDPSILEIQKFYFAPEIRGFGFAKKFLNMSFEHAKKYGFKSCYLETTSSLWQAVKLYEKYGFERLESPKGNTGHSKACEIYMLKNLNE